MSPDLWVPGVLILAFGAAAGWWLTRRRPSSSASVEESSRALAAKSSLEVEDLRHRRDELYARLRGAELDEKERRSLELEAAKVLQRLDAEESRESAADEKAAAKSDRVATPHSKARTLLTGFAYGGATAALIALLVFWAGRDATEREPMPGQGGGGPTAEQPHPVGPMPPEVAAEVAQLQERLSSEPGDLGARKRLALLYLNTDQYVPAFEQAEAVLAAVPDDIDSLYVQGVVRMTMGQDDAALAQLDRVLELFPNHVRAMTVQGLVFARQGNRDRAAAIWNRALEIGGPQPQIENLLAMLEAEGREELPPGHPPATGAPGESAQAGGITAPSEYRVRVEADTIPGFQQTGSLFVSLRTQPGGPPIAVRRINQPTFPMLVSVGAQDMMMTEEGELPESGLLTVRLDQDGSVSTRGEDDLEGSAEMSRGDLVTIVLD
ncbi:MAG: tetratricopeptide repeat protein [bacterium]|nr:tetratricopeptide repeat protein [bacterium]